jgi:hypothetical protein
VAIGIGEVSDLIDDEEAGGGVVAEPATEGGIAVAPGKFAE